MHGLGGHVRAWGGARRAAQHGCVGEDADLAALRRVASGQGPRFRGDGSGARDPTLEGARRHARATAGVAALGREGAAKCWRAGSARLSAAAGPEGALPAGGGARLSLVGARRLRLRLDAGRRTRSSLCRPVVWEACWWPCTSVACLLCAGCAVQWRYGSTSAYCMGVAAPGESLAGAGRPAATAPVGIAILLAGVVGDLTTTAPGSSPSGESPDPVAGLAVVSSSTLFPSLGRRLEDFDPFGASYNSTCTVASVATMTAVSNVGGVTLVMVVGPSSLSVVVKSKPWWGRWYTMMRDRWLGR
ncbi:hypothetical protein VPH35_055077 [Triticum aestivum]|uniref:Uncharacterized protein n=1 Tax=Triticum aestivum TaxID=4565 RepID=A0A077RQJ3_WHEAT|nr:unnamed protein product [Triticum aestivum]